MKKIRAAILISGRGSNMKALVEAARDPDYPIEIVLVVSNREDAAGLDHAKHRNIPTLAVENRRYCDRESHENAIHTALVARDVDLICLAGYMRILTPGFVDKWPGRILNIHPSLLPKYPGLNTHQRALDAGDKKHGCTVHIVTGDLDAGPAVLQKKVAVLDNDNAKSLAARVLEIEHRLYVRALAMVANDMVLQGDGRELRQ